MRDQGSCALLTGASGFIGRAVLLRLLARGGCVYAVVRRMANESAERRLAAALGVTALPADLQVIEGDLAQPKAGLPPDVVRRLRADVDVLYHCAGDTTFVPEDEQQFARTHVQGPVGLLDALAGARLSRCVHVSTAFICGRRSGTVYEHEDDVGQQFHNAYERAKLLSERAVRRAAAQHGIALRVARPSIVIGSPMPTTGAVPSERLLRFVALLATVWGALGALGMQLRIEAAPEASFNIVPLEYVADAVVVLGRASVRLPSAPAYHLVCADVPSQREVLEMLARKLGIRGVSLVDAQVGRPSRPSIIERTVDQLSRGYRDYLQQNVRFDDRHARAALVEAGLAPARIDEAFVERLVELALQTRSAQPAVG